MNKVIWALLLSVFLFQTSAFADGTSSAEVLKDFRAKIKGFLSSYPTNVKVVKPGGGYVSEYYDVKPEYNIDVQATNSLITPYTGVLEFKIIRYFTGFHKNEEDARKDNNYVNKDEEAHKHYYSFQDNEWVVTKRTHHAYMKFLSRPSLDEWFSCGTSLKAECAEHNMPNRIVNEINSK